MPDCAFYARASTDKQGDTIENQIEILREYVKRKSTDDTKWVIKEDYIFEDEGVSASKVPILARPSMKRLISDAKSGKFDTVLFKGISRFARDTEDALSMLRVLKAVGVRVISLEENYDSNTSSEFIFTIYSATAQEESLKTSIRVSLGNKSKARTGKWANSKPPIGYIVDKETKKLTLGNEDEIETVKKIFNLYVNEGLGTFKIAEVLNKEGIFTSSKNKWSRTSVARILKNRAYMGDIVYGKKRYEYIKDLDGGEKKKIRTVRVDESDWAVCENAHPAIIDSETFSKAQVILNSRNVGQTFKRVVHPLTGLLKCGVCGTGMVCQKRSNNKKDYRYYICKKYHKFGRDACQQANINADQLEQFLFETLKEKISRHNTESLIDQVAFAENSKRDITKKINQIDKDIAKINQDTVNLIKKVDILTDEQFKFANDVFKKELNTLQNKKQLLEEQLISLESVDNIKLLQAEMKNFLKEDEPDLRKYFHLLFNEVIIKETELEIKYTFD